MRKYINSLNGFLVLGFMLASVALFADSARRYTIFGTGARRNTVEWDFIEASSGAAMDLIPGTDNTNSFGTASKRIKDIQAMTATFGGAVTTSGAQTFTSNVTISTSATVSGNLQVTGLVRLGTITVATSTPPFAGALAIDASNKVYVATGSTHSGDWTLVGGQ